MTEQEARKRFYDLLHPQWSGTCGMGTAIAEREDCDAKRFVKKGALPEVRSLIELAIKNNWYLGC